MTLSTSIHLLLTSLTLAIPLAACGDENAEAPPETTNVALDAPSAAAEFIAALEAQDFDAVNDLVTDDVEWEVRATFTGETADEQLTRYSGREAVLAFFQQIADTFEQTQFSQTALFVADEDNIIFAELKGDFRVRGTGDAYQNLYLFKMTMQDGRVQHLREYYNPIHAARVLGVNVCE